MTWGVGIFWQLIVRDHLGCSLVILRERYTTGEIDDDEYERRLNRLQ